MVRGVGLITTQDIAARLRAIDNAEFQARRVPPRETLVWALPPAPVQMARDTTGTANMGSVQAVSTRDLAQLAANAGNEIPNPPPGFQVASISELNQLGLRPQDLAPLHSAFRAQVCVSGEGDAAQFVVAFCVNGAAQSRGLPIDHVTQALAIAKALARHPEAQVVLTGNDRGAELASITASASGCEATVFERPALPKRSDAGIGRAAEIAAFYVSGEVMSAIQDGGARVIGAIFPGVSDARYALSGVRLSG